MTTQAITTRLATHQEWSAIRAKVSSHNCAAFDDGTMPVFADREGRIKLLPPTSLVTRDLPTYAYDPPAAPPTPPDVTRGILSSIFGAGDDPEVKAAEAALDAALTAPQSVLAPRAAIAPTVSDAILLEIERMGS